MRVLLPGLLLASLTASVGCDHGAGFAEPSATPPPPPLVVETVRVVAPSAHGTVRRAGIVEPFRRTTLGTRLLARAIDVPVREGVRVVRGDTLVVLDVRDLRARRGQAAASRRASTAQVELASSSLVRAEALEAQGALAESQLEAARSAASLSEAQQAGAAQLLREIDINMSEGVLRAPFDGVVVQKRLEVGSLTVPGAPLFVLEDDARLRVLSTVAAEDVEQLVVGQPYAVWFPGERRADGVLDAIVSSGDPRFPVLSAIFIVENAEHALRAGVVVGVDVPDTQARPQGFDIPASALVRRGGLVGVYLVDDGRARRIWCSVATRPDSELVRVLDGLREGDVIVRDATMAGLADGTRLEVPR